MRRPTKTKKQRAFDKTQRALRYLAKTAVRWSVASTSDDQEEDDGYKALSALTEMQNAAYKFTNSLSVRDARRMLK